MVTHSSTSRPVQCLCMAERTGCPVFTDLWSYVLCRFNCTFILLNHNMTPYHITSCHQPIVPSYCLQSMLSDRARKFELSIECTLIPLCHVVQWTRTSLGSQLWLSGLSRFLRESLSCKLTMNTWHMTVPATPWITSWRCFRIQVMWESLITARW